jgi:CHASE3 domain sensor protein
MQMASEEELNRRAEEARVRTILEPKHEEARARMRRLRREAEERHAAEIEQQKTRRFAILLLIALLATTVLAAVRWLMLN